MSELVTLFPTRLWREALPDAEARALNADILAATALFAEEDAAGRAWCAEHAYPGYTSYGSLDDLPARAPCFAALKKRLDRSAAAFAKALHLDLGAGRLALDNLWVNSLPRGGFHAGHIHPHAVISGTYYAALPKGAAALKIEDPRLPLMMAAPPPAAAAPPGERAFAYLSPAAGTVLMWESWLRHEVPVNASKSPRVSVSFNYRWVAAKGR